jgi:tRNA (guanine-N(7)-)-methyltransferase subunit TRM82
VTDSDEVLIKKFKFENGGNQYSEALADDVNGLFAQHLSTGKIEIVGDLSILFKKKFDNVKSYHERKKRRIEEKNHAN